MEQIITVIISTLCGIIIAAGSVVIAYLHKKTKQLEEKNKRKEEEIKALHNGFRDYVYKEIKELKTDMKLVKNLVVENKVHYKELEEKK